MRNHFIRANLGCLILAIGTFSLANSALGQSSAANKAKRCATRLSVTMFGQSASPALLANPDPQATVDTMLADPIFIERFSRFINSEFNEEPGETTLHDSAYHLTKHVLETGVPYKDLFVGQYDITNTGNDDNPVATVSANPEGLGYFRTNEWMRRYAGDEGEGWRIVAGYRMLNNVLGTELIATTNVPDADISATGRQAAGCRSCHFDGWFALDNLAQVLSKVQRDDDMNITGFLAPDATPKPVLGGLMATDDKDLITKMVDSEEFAFNSCRLAFKFMYGRDENTCEGKLFDDCMSAFKSSGMMQSALATIAKDKSFCQ